MSNPGGGDGGHPGQGHHPGMPGNPNMIPGQHDRGQYQQHMRRDGYRGNSQHSGMMGQPPMHRGQMPPNQGHGGNGGNYMRGSSASGGGWQNPDRDVELRRRMIARIITLLRQRKPEASTEWINKLPDMAKKLEDRLYQYSASEHEYTNPETLTHRLQTIALQITRDRASQRQQQQQQQQQHHQQQQPPQQLRAPQRTPTMNQGHPQHPHSRPSPSYPPIGGGQGSYPPNDHLQHQPPAAQQPRRPSSNLNARSSMRPGSVTPTTQGHMFPPHNQGMRSNHSHHGGLSQSPAPVPSSGMSQTGSVGIPGSGHSANMGDSRQQRNLVLKQQQHRLLLLRHASRCTYPEGSCPATPHCAQYKRLWVHIASCRDSHCETPHCVSSRYVLSHYHRCQETNCAVCGPVREAIDRQNQMKLHQQQQRGGNAMSFPNRHAPKPGATPSGAGRQMSMDPPRYMPGGAPGLSPSPAGSGQGSPFPYHNQSSSASMSAHGTRPNSRPIINSNVPPGHGAVHSSLMTSRRSAGGLDPPPVAMASSHSHRDEAPGPASGSGPQSEVEMRLAELERRRQELEEKKRREAEEQQKIDSEIRRLQNIKGSGAAPGAPTPAPSSRMLQRNPSQSYAAQSSGGSMPVAAPAAMPPHSSQPSKRRALEAPGQVNSAAVAPGQPVSAHSSQTTMVQTHEVRKQRFVQSLQSMQNQCSLIYNFDMEEIEAHVKSLSYSCASSTGVHAKQSDIRQRATTLIKSLLDHEYSWIFSKPVDPVQLEIPDYFDVIKTPMDLGTVKRNIELNTYKSLKQFAHDTRLVFNNAMLYNAENSDVHGIAKQFGWKFEKEYNQMLRQIREDETLKRKNANACMFCGGEKYTFEPPVYYCNGKCNQKIRRGAFFYVTPDNKQFYCLTCYNSCVKDQVVLEDGAMIGKDKLLKKKNDEVQEESWVECNMCKRWYHQICVLFNARKNDPSKNEPFYCPVCVLRFIEQLKTEKLPQPKDALFAASDLPETSYSRFLELRVKRRILETRKEMAIQKKKPLCEIEDAGQISIRIVSCRDTELMPRSGMERLYGESEDYPKSFPHRVKCVLLFEKIDGVDLLILGMYTQVYGSDCPAPNARTLYISYLDSVYYFDPPFCRTGVYQELLESTLEFEKKRGVTKTFIWVCPPLAGDDYILYCHPKDQKTPKADMLRNWYFKLLDNCRKKGIVVSMDNLYDAYLQRVCNVTEVPYFDGDYWPGVTETFIEQLESEKIDPKSVAPRKKRVYSRNKQLESKSKGSKSKSKRSKSKGKKQTKMKKKNKKNKSKQKPLEEENQTVEPQIKQEVENQEEGEENEVDADTVQELNSDSFFPPKPLPILEVPQQDALTVKISDMIQQMKEDFIVVYMHHICASCCIDLDKPDMIYWLPEKYDAAALTFDYSKSRYAPPYALCDGCYKQKWAEEFGDDSLPNYDGLQSEKVSIWEDDFEKLEGFSESKEDETNKEIKEAVQAKLNEIITSLQGESPILDEDEADAFFMKKEEEDTQEEVNVQAASEKMEMAPAEIPAETSVSVPAEKSVEVPAKVETKPEETPEVKAEVAASPPPAEVQDNVAEKENQNIVKEEKTEHALPALKLEDVSDSKSNLLASPRSMTSNNPNQIEEIITVLPEKQTAARRSAWLEAPCGLLHMKPMKTNVAEKYADTDPQMDCQFFDTRQQFLSLCQGNRYQFDQLRRAKHSSMMVLYHLHNPELPSFIHSCNSCRVDITNGHRYSCGQCEDFDLCENCVRNVTHIHPLECVSDPNNPSYPGTMGTKGQPAYGMPVGAKGAKAAGVVPGQGYGGAAYGQRYQKGAYKQNRPQKVQAHMALLLHASNCNNPECSNRHCFRMKQLLRHGATCPTRVQGSCKICRRIWGLLHLHARQCRERGSCNVPSCNKLRDHLRRLAAQSQDRRIRMQTQRMQQERMQAQQTQMAQHSPPGSARDPRASPYGASSPNLDVQRGAKHGKNIS